MIGIIYPVWFFVAQLVDSHSKDTFVGRLIVGFFAILLAIGAMRSKRLKQHLGLGLLVSGIVLISHLSWLGSVNGFSKHYFAGVVVSFFCLTIGFVRIQHIFVFAIATLVALFVNREGFTGQDEDLMYVLIATLTVVSVVNSFTKNKLIRSLSQSEARSRHMVANLPVAAVYRTGQTLHVNRAAHELTGYGKEALMTVGTWFRTLFPDQWQNAERTYEMDRADGFGVVRSYAITRKDGAKRFVELAAYRDESIEVWILNDVTNAIAAQENLVTTSKMASLGQMAGGLAHEINNPLTVILGNAEQIKARSRDNLDIRRKCDSIISTSWRIANIVLALRRFARDEDLTQRKPVFLSEIIKDGLGFCQEKMRSLGITLVNETGDSRIAAYCSPVATLHILVNLLSNAIDAVEGQLGAEIKIEIRDQRDIVQLVVSDNGPGVDTMLASRIMDPFFTTKDIGKGVGLGLSVSKGLAERQDGNLVLDRTMKSGARFLLTLPKAESARKAA